MRSQIDCFRETLLQKRYHRAGTLTRQWAEKKDQTGLKGKKTLTKPTAMRDSFVYCLSLCDVSFGMERLRI